ncbi:MAG: adaptor protein MecA [Lachnospiraceae bacterium]|nr:adaptor protein MecA [Lachnospiraceae bacterium]MDY5498076.1 adaptor protein MecA [Anaerobutyricum sp.]
MKLEKINDNQIRCTLSKADLAQRQLHLSELAYGSEKAKKLFRDMMQQAALELGFEAENIPLMIEAIPVSSDCLVLVVTKVEDPDELDTRFSRFSRQNTGDMDGDAMDFDEMDFMEDATDDDEILSFGADEDVSGFSSETEDTPERSPVDEALDLIAPFTQAIAQAKKEALKKKKESETDADLCQYYSFKNFDQLTKLGSFLAPFYEGDSSLYKDASSGTYYLILNKGQGSRETFQRACNIAADFGMKLSTSYATVSYFKEHFENIVTQDAIFTLGELC